MKLKYIGNGQQYLHEDWARGIPPIPPTDYETDDQIAIAVALESGLYEEGQSSESKAEEKAEDKAAQAAKEEEAKIAKDAAVVERAQAKAAETEAKTTT